MKALKEEKDDRSADDEGHDGLPRSLGERTDEEGEVDLAARVAEARDENSAFEEVW